MNASCCVFQHTSSLFPFCICALLKLLHYTFFSKEGGDGRGAQSNRRPITPSSASQARLLCSLPPASLSIPSARIAPFLLITSLVTLLCRRPYSPSLSALSSSTTLTLRLCRLCITWHPPAVFLEERMCKGKGNRRPTLILTSVFFFFSPRNQDKKLSSIKGFSGLNCVNLCQLYKKNAFMGSCCGWV